jgi:hypothetical protein
MRSRFGLKIIQSPTETTHKYISNSIVRLLDILLTHVAARTLGACWIINYYYYLARSQRGLLTSRSRFTQHFARHTRDHVGY